MKFKLSTVTLALALTLACSTQAFAEKHRGKAFDGRAMEIMKGLSKLDLSIEQKQEIRSVLKQSREDNSIYRADKKEFKDQMRQVMDSPVWDEALARSVLQAQMDLGQPIALNRAKTRHQVFHLLTDEQQQSLMEKGDKRKQRANAMKGKSGKKKSPPQMKRLAKALDLSEQQIVEIKALREAAKTSMQSFREASIAQRQQGKAIIQADVFNEDSWLALEASLNDDKMTQRLAQTKLRYDTLAVLNEDQKAKFQKIMKKMKVKGRKAGSM